MRLAQASIRPGNAAVLFRLARFGLFCSLLVSATDGEALAASASGLPQNSGGPVSEETAILSRCGGNAQRYPIGRPSGSDDGPAIRQTIGQAIADLASGKIESADIEFEAGATYQLGGQEDNYDAINIKTTDLSKSEIKCLTMSGNGATLLLDPSSRGIYIGGCTDCVLKNFSITSARTFSSQGMLVATGAADGYAYADVDVANPFPLDKQFTYETTKNRATAIALTAVFHRYLAEALPYRLTYQIEDKAPWQLPPYLRIDHMMVIGRVAGEGSRVIRVFFDSRGPGSTWALRELSSLRPGKTIVEFKADFPESEAQRSLITAALNSGMQSPFAKEHPMNATTSFFVGAPSSGIFAELNRNLLLYNIRLSDIEGIGIFLSSNMGPVTIDGVRIVPKFPGHLLSSGADGIHMVNNREGATIRNSTIENTTDDMLNFSGEPYYAIDFDGTTVTLDVSVPTPVLPGDRFLVFNRSGQEVGEYNVIAAKALPPRPSGRNGYVVTFEKIPPNLPAYLNGGYIFVNLDMANAHPLVENNMFVDGSRDGIIIRGGGTIQNNLFLNLGQTAVLHSTEDPRLSPPRGKWGDLEALTIEGNTVIDTIFGLLNDGRGSGGSNFKYKGVQVLNNIIMGAMNFAVKRFNENTIDPVTANGNRIQLADTDPRTERCDQSCLQRRFIQDPQWSTPIPIEVLSPARLMQMKKAASPLPQLSSASVCGFFNICIDDDGSAN